MHWRGTGAEHSCARVANGEQGLSRLPAGPDQRVNRAALAEQGMQPACLTGNRLHIPVTVGLACQDSPEPGQLDGQSLSDWNMQSYAIHGLKYAKLSIGMPEISRKCANLTKCSLMHQYINICSQHRPNME